MTNTSKTIRLTGVIVLALLVFTSLIYLFQNKYIQPLTLLGVLPEWVFNADAHILSCNANKNTGVFIQTAKGVYLLDSSGNIIWNTKIDKPAEIDRGYITRIGIKSESNILIVPRDNGEIVAIGTLDGKLLWEDLPISKRAVFDIDVDQNMAYISKLSSSLTAIDLESGDEVWSTSVPDRTAVYVFSVKDKVYLGTDYAILKYNAQNGELLMKRDLSGLTDGIFVDAENIYITLLDGEYSVVSLDPNTFESRWSISKEDLPTLDVDSIVIKDNAIYISGDQIIKLSASSGEILWKIDQNDSFGKPLIQGNNLLVQGNTHFYVFDNSDGQLLDRQRIPALFPVVSVVNMTNSQPCQGKSMFWITAENRLYGFKLLK